MSKYKFPGKKKLLARALMLAAWIPLAAPVVAQQDDAAQVESPQVETQIDTVAIEEAAELDITLQVVEDAQSAEDLLNNIELPDDVRELAEQKLAAVLAALKAAREAQPGDANRADREALLSEMEARSAEMMAGAQNSALAANEQAQQAMEFAREVVEEALKNGLTNADMEGMIEQMMQDMLGALPEGAAGNTNMDVDVLLDSLRGDGAGEGESDGAGSGS